MTLAFTHEIRDLDFHQRVQTKVAWLDIPQYRPGHIVITDPLLTVASEDEAWIYHAKGICTLSGLACDQWVDSGLVHKRAVTPDGTPCVIAWPVTS